MLQLHNTEQTNEPYLERLIDFISAVSENIEEELDYIKKTNKDARAKFPGAFERVDSWYDRLLGRQQNNEQPHNVQPQQNRQENNEEQQIQAQVQITSYWF